MKTNESNNEFNIIHTNNDLYDDIMRKNNNRIDSLSISTKNNRNDVILCDESNDNSNEISINIYRYKFTNDVLNNLYQFAKIHEFDYREDFKKAWNEWLIENNELVEKETFRLLELGYEGDIIDKMFKSARYYLRKKSTEKNKQKKRKEYININSLLLNEMDSHIKISTNNPDYKPSLGFNEFCKSHIDLLKKEVTRLVKECNMSEVSEIKNKIKKTYKNRYFMIITK
jgi:hypothetical protein